MVAPRDLSGEARSRGRSGVPFGPVARLRIAIALVLLLAWEALAASGAFRRDGVDIVPTLDQIARALVRLLGDPELYTNLAVSSGEIAASLAIGGTAGVAVGLALGSRRLPGRAFEPFLHYLGPTPKIVFFPVFLMWFGVGPGSKVAMGAVSCFFPLALSVAVGARQIDAVLLRVGRSFRASTVQTVAHIYLPALRGALLGGLRLGLGVAVIGVLLAETKLSNRGLGYLVMQLYSNYDLAGLYALLAVIIALAILANGLLGRLERSGRSSP